MKTLIAVPCMDMMHTGFSMAMRSQSAFANCIKNSTASSLSLSVGKAVFVFGLKPFVSRKSEVGAWRVGYD